MTKITFNTSAGKGSNSGKTKEKTKDTKPETKAINVKASSTKTVTQTKKADKQKETKVNIKTFEPTKPKQTKGNVTTINSKATTSSNTNKVKSTNKIPVTKRIEQRFTPLFQDVTPSTVYNHVTKELGWNLIRIVTFVLLLVIFIMHIIGTATTNWMSFHAFQTHGLWRICYQSDPSSNDLECFRYDNLPDYVKQMQALMMVALILLGFGLVYFYIWLRKTDRPLVILTIAIEIAALLMVFAMAIYTDKNFCVVARAKIGTFGWSYYLGWLTTLFTIGAGIFIQLKV